MMTSPKYGTKIIDGKRLSCILSQETFQNLQKQMAHFNAKNTTQFLEKLINGNDSLYKNGTFESKMFDEIKVLNSIRNLIEFNKKNYKDLNATFNNINQIAYSLNLAFLLEQPIELEEMNEKTQEVLAKASNELKLLRETLKKILLALEKKEKGYKK